MNCLFYPEQKAILQLGKILNKQNIEKIVIGQRLGQFLNEQPKRVKHLFRKDTIAPVEFSFQREIAALGAAWKGSC